MIVRIFGHVVPWFPLELIYMIYSMKSTCLWIRRFSSATFLDFLFSCFVFLLLLRCSLSLLHLDEEESREEVELILLLFLCELLFKDIFFLSCLRSFWAIFWKICMPSYFSQNLRKKLFRRFSQILELRPLDVWITKLSGEANQECKIRWTWFMKWNH